MYEVITIFVLTMSAILTGPRLLLARRLLCWIGARAQRQRLGNAAAVGLVAGLATAVCTSALMSGAYAATQVSLLAILFLIAIADFAWRWIPLSWTIGLLVGGLLLAEASGDLVIAAMASGASGIAIIVMRTLFWYLRGVEGIGVGDATLLAAMAPYTGVDQLGVLVLVASLIGLAVSIRQILGIRSKRHRFGIPFGSCLCLSLAIIYV